MNNKQLIKKHAFYNFRDEQTFQTFLNTKYHSIWKHKFKDFKKSLDCIAVKGILFTMDSYDMGKEIMWGNKEKQMQLTCETQDRYKYGYKDAKVELYPEIYFRNDINYIQ